MDLEPKAPTQLGPRGESPRVLGQGPRLGRADGPYIGVYNTNTRVGGQLIAAANVVRSAPSYGLALRPGDFPKFKVSKIQHFKDLKIL